MRQPEAQKIAMRPPRRQRRRIEHWNEAYRIARGIVRRVVRR